jgi:hypothetical protein
VGAMDDLDEALQHFRRKHSVMTCPHCKKEARFVAKKVPNPFAERDPTATRYFLAMACTLCGRQL